MINETFNKTVYVLLGGTNRRLAALVKTEKGDRQLYLPPEKLFNHQMPVWEQSAECCQNLHFVFKGRTTRDLGI